MIRFEERERLKEGERGNAIEEKRRMRSLVCVYVWFVVFNWVEE